MTLTYPEGLQTLAQVRTFVSDNEAISVTLTDRLTAYGWMTDTLWQFHYMMDALHGTLSGNHHA